MKKIILVMFAVSTALAVAFAAACARAQDAPDPIRILVPVTKGIEGGSLSKLMQEVVKVMEQESGYNFVYQETTYRMGDDDAKLVYDALKDGKAEVTYLRSIELIRRKDEWEGIFNPAFVMVFNGANHQEECFYVLEDSGINSIEDMRGKSWGGAKPYTARMILHDNGIDEPLSKFFGELKFFEDAPPARSIKTLQSGFVEVVTNNRHHLEIGGAGVVEEGADGNSSKKYKTIACTPGELNWVFAFHKDVPQPVVDKLTKLFTTAHKNQAFRQFHFIFMAIKGGFAPIKEKDWALTKEIVDLGNEYGWWKEQDEFVKQRPK